MTTMKGFQKTLFLKEYWQQKPCVIKGFFPDFVDPIDEHDLAGLAQENEVDSRLISFADGVWTVNQGPIEDFAPLCMGAWTLLVQGVDKYIDEVHALSAMVDSIPHWRFEDVMVSFSTPHAGVGAHIDEYDVIIVQGKGSRRWQIGLPAKFEHRIPHPKLKQINDFLPIIDEILAPGDAIYIPPKHPHNGVAITECLNYSIGFRAPTNLEIFAGIVDESSRLVSQQQRYSDPDIEQMRQQTVSPCQVSTDEIDRLKMQVNALLQSNQASQSLVQFLSRQNLPDMAPEALIAMRK